MGLEPGWITHPVHELTPNQQIKALGNGVMPKHASLAIYILSGGAAEHRTFAAGLDALDV